MFKISKLVYPKTISAKPNMVVVITGCDSGLGLMMAKSAHRKGLTVIAGVYQGLESSGARQLKSVADSNASLHVVELDVTKEDSVNSLKTFTKDLLSSNKDMSLHAVVNNAGVSIFGDFEWQTSSLAQKQWNVNVCGTWNVTRNLMWALRESGRKNKHPRIIHVNSHCGHHPLKTLAIYSATKAALRAWSEALRVEMKYCGVNVVEYIPGRVTQSNIFDNQMQYFDEMKNSLDEEQRAFYGKYFEDLTTYLQAVSKASKPKHEIYQEELEDIFMRALLDEKPRHIYKTEPWRYTFYYNLFNLVPNSVKSWLVDKFMGFPSLKSK